MKNRPEDGEPIPLVIIQGFLGSTGAWLWGNFENYLNMDSNSTPRRTIFVRFELIIFNAVLGSNLNARC
jgi:hypothetical protein